jgi:transcriptional regulator with XRE-family HTH domain
MLRGIRTNLGLTQKEICRYLRMREHEYRDAERGRRGLTFKQKCYLLKLLLKKFFIG